MSVKLFALLGLLLLVVACGSKAPIVPESQVQPSAQQSAPEPTASQDAETSQDADIVSLTESIESVDESELGAEYLDTLDQDLSAVDELE